MRLEPWLCLGDVEVGNAMRTLTYLRRGLGGGYFDVGVRSPLLPGVNPHYVVVGDVYEDTYTDLYGGAQQLVYDGDEMTAANLLGYCADLDDGPYVSPQADDAPWYSSARPESADFLGFIPWVLKAQSTVRRSGTASSRGSTVGPSAASGQLLVVQGTMYASTREAMEYGERWLTDLLADGLCDYDIAAQVLPACPGGGRAAQWRSLPHVGIVDGPVFDPIADGIPECLMQSVGFQLLSESPFLLGDPETMIDATMATDVALHHLIVTDDSPGDWGVRYTFKAGGTDVSLVLAIGYATDGCCPCSGPADSWRFNIRSLPAGYELIVDGVERVVEGRNPATGQVIGGLDYLDFVGEWIWPEVSACSNVCLSMGNYHGGVADGLDLTIELVKREL